MIGFIKSILPKRVVIEKKTVFTNEWIEIDYKNMETSHDQILVTNERGWYRVCRCLGGKRNGVDFYDNYDRVIKGFNPTHYMRLHRPIINVSYEEGLK